MTAPIFGPRTPLGISVVLGLLTTACATMAPAGPTHFYASWSGLSEQTQPVFDAVDARMRREAGFVRDFAEPMNVHIENGSPASKGRFRYVVRITIPERFSDRRIREKDRTLSEFSVMCEPIDPQPCVEDIVARALAQPAKIRRIVARSPKA